MATVPTAQATITTQPTKMDAMTDAKSESPRKGINEEGSNCGIFVIQLLCLIVDSYILILISAQDIRLVDLIVESRGDRQLAAQQIELKISINRQAAKPAGELVDHNSSCDRC